MSRESVKATERTAILRSLAAHPTLLLLGSPEVSRKRVLEALASITVESKQSGMQGNMHPDCFYLDAKDREMSKTESLREIMQAQTFRPAQWEFRDLIIGHFDRLHPKAAQLLLKMIEEPPTHLKSILLTSRPAALTSTIKSRSIELSISPPSLSEIEEILTTLSAEEPVWRARYCGQDVEVAMGLDLKITKEWQKLVSVASRGTPPPPEMAYTWTKILDESNEATQQSIWTILIEIVSRNNLDHITWKELGELALREKERVKQGRAHKVAIGTAMTFVYALLKTIAKK